MSNCCSILALSVFDNKGDRRSGFVLENIGLSSNSYSTDVSSTVVSSTNGCFLLLFTNIIQFTKYRMLNGIMIMNTYPLLMNGFVIKNIQAPKNPAMPVPVLNRPTSLIGYPFNSPNVVDSPKD